MTFARKAAFPTPCGPCRHKEQAAEERRGRFCIVPDEKAAGIRSGKRLSEPQTIWHIKQDRPRCKKHIRCRCGAGRLLRGTAMRLFFAASYKEHTMNNRTLVFEKIANARDLGGLRTAA